MDTIDKQSFQAAHRHPERVAVMFPVVLAVLGAAVYWIVQDPDHDDLGLKIGVMAGAPLGLLLLSVLNAVRGHDWRLLPEGLEIRRWPRFRLFGIPRRWMVPYEDIAALRRIETALNDAGAELVTKSGAVHYMAEAFGRWGTIPRRRAMPAEERETDLDRFLALIRATAAMRGNEVPIVEGLDFWSRATGLALLLMFLLLTLGLAAVVLWAIFDGADVTTSTRGGQATAIVVLLPFGVLYLIWRSLKRRRAVSQR